MTGPGDWVAVLASRDGGDRALHELELWFAVRGVRLRDVRQDELRLDVVCPRDGSGCVNRYMVTRRELSRLGLAVPDHPASITDAEARPVPPVHIPVLAGPDAQRAAAADQITGTWAEWGLTGEDIDGLLNTVIAELGRQPELLVVHAESGDYGSGCASFIDVDLTHRDGTGSRALPGGGTETDCLKLALCRIAPVAALFLPSMRTVTPGGRGSWTLPHAAALTRPPVPGWEQASRRAEKLLAHHGIAIADPDFLHRPAVPGLRIDTNLAAVAGSRDLFDVYFHWND